MLQIYITSTYSQSKKTIQFFFSFSNNLSITSLFIHLLSRKYSFLKEINHISLSHLLTEIGIFSIHYCRESRSLKSISFIFGQSEAEMNTHLSFESEENGFSRMFWADEDNYLSNEINASLANFRPLDATLSALASLVVQCQASIMF